MFDIKLNKNNAYKWYRKNDIYVIGHIIKDQEIYYDEKLIEYLSGVNKIDDLKELLKNTDGFYSIIIKTKEGIILAADVVRSFPVFYRFMNDKIIISDDINYFSNKIIDLENEKLFKASGFVIDNGTLYKDIYQIEGAQLLLLRNDGVIEKDKHFLYNHNINKNLDKKSIVQELNILYDSAIKKLIKYIDGKRVVIPLSGGHDSRLIVYYLYKNGYKNVLTYTYGRKGNPEAEVSKKVADYLGYEWIFVEYKSGSMRKKYNSKKKYAEMANYCARGFSVTHIQEWEAIDKLIERKIINKEDVIVPGFSGDFIAGSHINKYKIDKEKYLISDLKRFILKKHYDLYNWKKYNNELEKLIWQKIKKKMNITSDDENQIECYEMNNILERFNFEERQIKFITNSIRIYDLYGVKWYMPLWDRKLMEFWLTVDLPKKCERKIYYTFAEEIYGDLNKVVQVADIKKDRQLNNVFLQKIQSITKLYKYYFKHFLNYYGYLKFGDYLKFCFKYGSGSYYFMFACNYIKYILRREKNEN